MEVIPKVVIYVVQTGHLLVFVHPEVPEAGLQVPAGSVNPGEQVAAAARRELWEETGIQGASFRLLGTTRYDMAVHGRAEVHERSFFHAEPRKEQSLDRRWRHLETHDGVGEPDVFELFWVPLDTPDLATELEAGQGEMLEDVKTVRGQQLNQPHP